MQTFKQNPKTCHYGNQFEIEILGIQIHPLLYVISHTQTIQPGILVMVTFPHLNIQKKIIELQINFFPDSNIHMALCDTIKISREAFIISKAWRRLQSVYLTSTHVNEIYTNSKERSRNSNRFTFFRKEY